MNLAICSAGEIFGGVERQILDLCRFQISSGWGAPMVVLFFDRELAFQLRELGLEPIVLRGSNRYDPRIVDVLAGLLRQRNIEVVHVHGYKATIACSLARRKTNFGLVKTEHGKVETTLASPLSWLKSRVNSAIDQFFTRRHVDNVCYVTDDIGGFFADSHRGMNRRTVYNGMIPLSAEDFLRPLDLPAEEINIGIVGRVSTVKGIPVAIKAMKLLQAQGKVRLKIIGTGNLVGPLKEMVAELGLEEVVQFLGFRRNIYDYLAHLDVLLMPSFHEGLPYTLLEAMSLARPVVASRVGGLQEVIDDGLNGLLCPPNEPAALAGCLEKILRDDSFARELGVNARRSQAKLYTLEIMGGQYAAIYREAATARSGGGELRG